MGPIGEIASVLAALIAGISFYSARRDVRWILLEGSIKDVKDSVEKLERKFETRIDQLDTKIESVKEDVKDISQRLSFIEGMWFSIDITSDVSNRSEGARKMWQRRKAKKIEHKED